MFCFKVGVSLKRFCCEFVLSLIKLHSEERVKCLIYKQLHCLCSKLPRTGTVFAKSALPALQNLRSRIVDVIYLV